MRKLANKFRKKDKRCWRWDWENLTELDMVGTLSGFQIDSTESVDDATTSILSLSETIKQLNENAKRNCKKKSVKLGE